MTLCWTGDNGPDWEAVKWRSAGLRTMAQIEKPPNCAQLDRKQRHKVSGVQKVPQPDQKQCHLLESADYPIPIAELWSRLVDVNGWYVHNTGASALRFADVKYREMFTISELEFEVANECCHTEIKPLISMIEFGHLLVYDLERLSQTVFALHKSSVMTDKISSHGKR